MSDDAKTEEFQDPLENYDPKTFSDPLERALAEEPVTQIQSQPYTSVPPTATVEEAVKKLASMHVACLLIEDEGKLVGVFTDRNVLDLVALDYDKLKGHEVREVMTPNPVFVYEGDPAAAALSVMAVCGFRHVPVVDAQEHLLGIISPQRVTAFLSQEMRDARNQH